MSPGRPGFFIAIEDLIGVLGNYNSGMEIKKTTAKHLKELLEKLKDGRVEKEDVRTYVDGQLNIPNNIAFKGLFGSKLQTHFSTCKALIK